VERESAHLDAVAARIAGYEVVEMTGLVVPRQDGRLYGRYRQSGAEEGRETHIRLLRGIVSGD
jgi:hypothetical protein